MVSISNNIDTSSLTKHLNFLTFDRQASTPGEKKTINYIQNELAEANIKNKTESFEWSKVNLEKLAFLGFACFIIFYETISFLFNSRWLQLVSFIFLTIVIILTSLNPLNFSRIFYFRKNKESRNVVAEIAPQNKLFKGPVAILSTHHDSAPEKPYYKLQSFLYIVLGFFSLIYLTLNLFVAFTSFFAMVEENALNFAMIISLFLGIGIVILLIFTFDINNIKDKKYNASGVAVLIELAKILKVNPLKNINVVLIWCGAEKSGLWGAKEYCAKNFFSLYEDYELDDSFHINFANVGHYIGLVKKTGLLKRDRLGEKINDILEASANNLKVSVKSLINPNWAGSNYMVFRAHGKKAEKNLQISCFTTLGKSKHFNSTNSYPIKLRVENISDCINICYNAMKSLDLRVE